MAGGADDATSKERPWSVEEMRSAAGNWSLASDAGMLQYLQDFSQKMASRTHAIQEEVNGLVHELKLSDVRVSNVFNDFIMLANTQFVENRVYDEDVITEEDSKKNEEPEKTKEQRESELIPKMTEAIAKGMSVMDTAFETLDVSEAVSDSEEEDTPYKTDPILEPKDPYINRPLPHLIGTPAFYQTDDVGLVEETSDKEDMAETESESESGKSESESDEEAVKKSSPPVKRPSHYSSQSESDSGSELFGDGKEPEEEYLSESDNNDSDGDENDIQEKVPVQPASFADELAAKLGGVVPPAKAKTKPDRKQKTVKRPSEKEVEKRKEPADHENEDLFGSSQKYNDEEYDDGFGGQNGLFSTKGGLFDDEPEEGGLFGEVQETKPKKRTSPEHEDRQSTEETTKAKTKKPAKKKTVVPASDDSDDDLFGGSSRSNDFKRQPSIPKDTSGLFDEGSDDDLFASLSSAKESKPAASAGSKPKPKAPLLVDSDEEGDLFNEMPTQQPPAAEVNEAPDSKPQEQVPKKKLPAGAVSMFGGAQNPFAAAIKKSHRKDDTSESEEEKDSSEDEKAPAHSKTSQSSSHIPPSGPLKSEPEVVTPSSGLFDNKPDDLFGNSDEKITKPSAPKGETRAAKKSPATPSLFDDVEDDEDDFFSNPTSTKKETSKPSQVQKEPSDPKSKTLLLEDEGSDEDDLFGSITAKPTKKKPVGGVSIFGDGFTMPGPKTNLPKSPVTTPEPVRPTQKKASLSLFDEEDEGDGGDLFGGGMPSSPKSMPDKPKSSVATKSEPTPAPARDNLFGGSDNLFGSSPEEDDLFQTSKPRTKPSQPVVSKPKSAQPTAPLLSSPEGEEDLFKTLPVRTVPIHNTSVQKPPAPSRTPQTKPSQMPKAQAKSALPKLEPVKSYIVDEPVSDPLGLGAPVDSVQKTSASQPNKKPMGPAKGPTISIVKPVGPPGKSTGVTKTRGTLNINPAALLPGAKPPAKTVEPAAVSFEDDVKADTLEHLGKSRAKVQNKRRPPTRKSRQTSQDVTSPPPSDPISSSPHSTLNNDMDPAFDRPVTMTGSDNVSQTDKLSPTRVTAPNAGGTLFANDDEEEDDLFATKKRIPKHEPSSKTPLDIGLLSEGSDLTETSTGGRLTNQTEPNQTEEKSSPGGGKKPDDVKQSGPKVSESESSPKDDLFSDQTNTKSEAKPGIGKPPPDDDLFDDTFGESVAKTKNLFGEVAGSPPTLGNDDIFGSNNAKTIKKQPVSSAPLIIADEDDLSGVKPPPLRQATKSGAKLNESSSAKKKPASALPLAIDVDDEDDLFGTKPPPFPEESNSLSPADDGDDIFGIPNSTSTKIFKPPPAMSTDDDIFGFTTEPTKKSLPAEPKNELIDRANPAPQPLPVEEDIDIFSSSRKPIVKKATSQPIMEDDDDIFSSAPKSEPRRSKKAVPTKDEDLFADDTDIFANTPPVKSKEKKTNKMSKAGSSAKSIFKNDVDDIFSDAVLKPKKTITKKSVPKKTSPATDSTDIFSDPLQDDIFK